jgi:hypothetical protein
VSARTRSEGVASAPVPAVLRLSTLITLLGVTLAGSALGQNPIIRDQYTADPTARVFGERVYLYPSHDIRATEGHGRPGWFCMEDYHVFSSADLIDWTDHGMIVSQTSVPWANAQAYSLWAPDAIDRNGKYYFYFPAPARDTVYGRGFSVGVAVADAPAGPFVPLPEPIRGVHGIDPNVFIDRDGQAYLYWAAREFYVAKLKSNMVELDGKPEMISGLPGKGLKEGPFMFERNGKYYLTYPHVENKTERLEYAMGDGPRGPFTVTGVIMDESPTGCWTNHQSIVEFKGQWYLFYHHNDYSPDFDKNRSVRIDSLFFNKDGTIRKVAPTLRGVGVTDASREIHIDRYSLTSAAGATTALLDTLHPFQGWKARLDSTGAWICYNAVRFGDRSGATVKVRAVAEQGGTVEIRIGRTDGPLLARVDIPAGLEWSIVSARVTGQQPGLQDLVVLLAGASAVEIDWVRFE